MAAILTGILVALKDVVASEFYFLLRHVIEHGQQDHPRHAYAKRDRVDAFRMGLRL